VVEDARVFDLPERPIKTYVAAGGRRAARLAAEVAGGVCATEPREDIVAAFHEAGGAGGATWGQVVLGWAADEETGLADAHAQFRFAMGGWKVQSELPNPVNFDAATQNVKPADLADTIPVGPDPDRRAEAVRAYLDAGYEHVAVAYPGNDPGGFMRLWNEELRPHLQ
jgi:G6PDH family F420-dependent oxidoreductase